MNFLKIKRQSFSEYFPFIKPRRRDKYGFKQKEKEKTEGHCIMPTVREAQNSPKRNTKYHAFHRCCRQPY